MSTHQLLKSLTLDERDLLSESMQSEVFNVYCKIINELLVDYKEAVLKYNLQDMTDSSLGAFALIKARQQGADSLALKFAALKQLTKQQR